MLQNSPLSHITGQSRPNNVVSDKIDFPTALFLKNVLSLSEMLCRPKSQVSHLVDTNGVSYHSVQF